MSYNLAVWDGPRPESNEAAGAAFLKLAAHWFDGQPADPSPTAPIRSYVEALLDRWPDITEDAGEDSPWADGPLINNAAGPLFYFAMVYSQAEEAVSFAAQLAAERGLICFDPQAEALLMPTPTNGPKAKRSRFWKRG